MEGQYGLTQQWPLKRKERGGERGGEFNKGRENKEKKK